MRSTSSGSGSPSSDLAKWAWQQVGRGWPGDPDNANDNDDNDVKKGRKEQAPGSAKQAGACTMGPPKRVKIGAFFRLWKGNRPILVRMQTILVRRPGHVVIGPIRILASGPRSFHFSVEVLRYLLQVV